MGIGPLIAAISYTTPRDMIVYHLGDIHEPASGANSHLPIMTKTRTGWFPIGWIAVPVMVIITVPVALFFFSRILYGKSLWRRALRYDVQGRYAKAEPILRRALAIIEKMIGPEHPMVARGLVDHAAILRALGREAEAAEMDARAKRIGPAPPGPARRRRTQGSTLE